MYGVQVSDWKHEYIVMPYPKILERHFHEELEKHQKLHIYSKSSEILILYLLDRNLS
jgi:hypothetical protein